VGILRYIVQGFGWELGSQAAREGIDALREQRATAEPPPPSRREQKRLAKERAKAAERATRERDEAIRRNQARIEAELRALKKKADR